MPLVSFFPYTKHQFTVLRLVLTILIVFLILDVWPFYCSLNRNCSMMKSRNHLWWADTSFFKSIRYEYDIYDIWHFTIPIYPVLMISSICYRNHLPFLCQFGCLSTCLCSLCIEDCKSCKQHINFASSCIWNKLQKVGFSYFSSFLFKLLRVFECLIWYLFQTSNEWYFVESSLPASQHKQGNRFAW